MTIRLSTTVDLDAFDPDDGVTLVPPDGQGPGHWAGAASAVWDHDAGRVLVAYRTRGPERRGHRICLTQRSDHGLEELWSASAGAVAAVSLERPCLVRARTGDWHLYYSYVSERTGRWQIDVTVAPQPEDLDVAAGRPAFTAVTTGTDGVKDPYVVLVGHVWFLFVNLVEPAPPRSTTATVGREEVLATGLATSLDGLSFTYQGVVLPLGEGWDAAMARLTSVVPLEEGYLAFYDGRPSAEENFEERVGLAFSFDLQRWLRLTPDGPWRWSPEGTGALRYVDALPVDGGLHLYYELARPDGSHELRESRIPASWAG